MQRLEEEMGVRLFDRQKSRLSLNENGELTVKYARDLLLQESSLIEKIREFDRKKRTISLGSCTPLPIPGLVSLLSQLYDGMTISTEVTDNPRLAELLKENQYQLVILHEKPDENEYHSCILGSEQLYVHLPPAHPLASSDGLYLKDLDGQTFLLYSQTGFWETLCRREMPATRFLMQPDYYDFGEIVGSSALPSFATDYFLKRVGPYYGRIAVPVLDKDASVTFYCTCLKRDKARFKTLFQRLNQKLLFDQLP